jgi:DNA-binding response OmpR family regulator
MHVLIVEEDAALGDFLAHGIKLEGHEVSVVPEGGMALHWAERLRPELMILDLKLPGRDELVLAGWRWRSGSVAWSWAPTTWC